MHPTGHALDAEFEPNSNPGTPLPGGGMETVIQDFNAFFEKLSGLDDVRWGDEEPTTPSSSEKAAQPPPPPGQPEKARGAAPTPNPYAKTAEPPPATPKAPTPQAAARAPAQAVPPAHLAPVAPGRKPEPHRAPAVPVPRPERKARLPLGFKLAVTALVLFAIGMGAGWLALSLPKNPNRTSLAENPLIPLERAAKTDDAAGPAVAAKPAPLPNPWDTAQPATPAKPEPGATVSRAVTPAPKASAAAPSAPVAPKAPEAATEPVLADDGTLEAFSEREPAVPKAPAPQAVTVELPKSPLFTQANNADGAPVPAVPAAPQAPATPQLTHVRATPPGSAGQVAPAARPSAEAPFAGEQYAVQVGACSSARCVENYRKLVQPHVGPHPVQVVRQAAANGTAVQRVRVEPLTREQAVSLKHSLEQADPRLKNAYVVKLAERS